MMLVALVVLVARVVTLVAPVVMHAALMMLVAHVWTLVAPVVMLVVLWIRPDITIVKVSR